MGMLNSVSIFLIFLTNDKLITLNHKNLKLIEHLKIVSRVT